MTPVERATRWRLENLDRYRKYQREYHRRKRMEKKLSRFTFKPNPAYPEPPEGYDPVLDGPDINNWLMSHGKPPQR